jgi:hypothetical protein
MEAASTPIYAICIFSIGVLQDQVVIIELELGAWVEKVFTSFQTRIQGWLTVL